MKRVAQKTKSTKKPAVRARRSPRDNIRGTAAAIHSAVNTAAVPAPSEPGLVDYAILGRYAFKRRDVEDRIEHNSGAVQDAADEVEAIAESLQDALMRLAGATGQAALLAACADRLQAAASRLMRHVGRLEAFEECLGHADRAYSQLAAHRAGRLPAFTSWPEVEAKDAEA